MEICPCGTNKPYSNCCESFINHSQIPETPEELMRSRYTAYTKANVDYIAETMKGPAAVNFDKEHAKQWTNQIKWDGLKVIHTETDTAKGSVEFMVYYSLNQNQEIIYEISEFHRENGRWYYFDGVTPKIGRNDNCPCGSQKKYKKCCGR